MLAIHSFPEDGEVPGVVPGDGEAVGLEGDGQPDIAASEHMPSLPADSLGRKIVMLANWNEFGEGHFLMPSTLAGFGYVDAMREVFAGGGAHEDVVPTEQPKSRFTVLYPK